MYLGFILLLLLGLSSLTVSQTLVKSLPGYPSVLPFKLETGYIGVGENEDVQLFYCFVESQGNPEEDPLIIWLDGGPGCSFFRGFFFETGPLQFQYGKYVDDVPALKLVPNSWIKVANVIYLDAPTFTGYSYAKTPDVISSDTSSASQTAEFLRKFVRDHPKFVNNPMYVTGISYSGMVIPMITEEIYKGNDLGLEPTLNIKGYMEGNPLTDQRGDINSRLEYAYRVALISYELFESTRKNCNGEYANADPNNLSCMAAIGEVNKRIENINLQNILEPSCEGNSDLFKNGNPIRHENRKPLGHQTTRTLRAQTLLKDVICRGDYHTYYSSIWANNKNVKKALNVREGTVKEWSLCNTNMTYLYNESSMPAYKFNVNNSVVYHANLTKRNCRALIFSGDHDMAVPHVGTRNWIHSLNLTITGSNWDAWYVEGQEAGYKTTYARNNYSLVFATVKGAGHIAPELKTEECFEMVKRWFARKPI